MQGLLIPCLKMQEIQQDLDLNSQEAHWFWATEFNMPEAADGRGFPDSSRHYASSRQKCEIYF